MLLLMMLIFVTMLIISVLFSKRARGRPSALGHHVGAPDLKRLHIQYSFRNPFDSLTEIPRLIKYDA